MANTLTPEQLAALEDMIDRTTLAIVLEAVADICDAKAQHLIENWQDPNSARNWQNAGGKVGIAARAAERAFGR